MIAMWLLVPFLIAGLFRSATLHVLFAMGVIGYLLNHLEHILDQELKALGFNIDVSWFYEGDFHKMPILLCYMAYGVGLLIRVIVQEISATERARHRRPPE